jgi:opacity protein-like surface antigen
MKTTWALFWFLIAGIGTGLGDSQLQEESSEVRRWAYRVEALCRFGWGGFWHGDDSLGNGLELGGAVGIRPFQGKLRGLGFEAQISQLQHDTQHSPTHSTNGRVLTFTGNVLYHFSDSTVQPYVVGGVGILKADYTRKGYSEWYELPEWEYHEEYWTDRIDASKMAINLGVGLKAALTPNLSIRPELQILDTTPGSGYNWRSVRLSIGVGYHW